ncbi:hypothetical protein WJX73_006244 [Symbiochloris irregularis]|uniref:Uncharacterized protein n=1 Tax=Symbiochloris irregularis TaxID=706552 RepID=A0AAW1NUF1_9CHLO
MAAPPENTDLPRALVSTIIKNKLASLATDGPTTEADKAAKVNLNKDALLAFVESAKIFISYLTATANDICHESKRQIINVDDVFTALEDIEFQELVGPLKEAVEAFREESKEKNAKKAERTKKRKQEEAAQAEAEAEAQEATAAAEPNGNVVVPPRTLEGERPVGSSDQEQAFVEDAPIEPLPTTTSRESAPPAAFGTAGDELTRSFKVAAEARGISTEASQPVEWISYAPADEITSPAARTCLASLQRCPINVPEMGRTVQTAYLCTNGNEDADPILLLPGFDSSCLEMRELLPRLQAINAEAWAVDIAGWGFSDAGLASSSADNPIALGPAERRAHLHAFWREKVKRPMLVVGTSLGAASAVDFATTHPEAVRKLAIIDGQAFVDGLGPVAKLPPWLAGLGVQVLRSKWLRRSAGKQSYHDKGMATEEAMLIGRLHTWQPGWSNGMVSFIRSGGYSVASQVPRIQQETLVIWGREDQILDPKLAEQFKAAIPNCTLAYIEGKRGDMRAGLL